MSRCSLISDERKPDVPRASGDEPLFKATRIVWTLCSPRERG